VSSLVRAGLAAVAIVLASTTLALAETSATPAPKKTVVAQGDAAPAPTPTPNPFSWHGFFRSYYFTRQNASNNPGTQFNFSPGAKYVSNGVNQASLNNAINLHADYQLPYSGWYVGATYFFAEPFNGPCSVAPAHAKGKPCVTQSPPNTNPDDTLPGFMLNTFPETYVGFQNNRFRFQGGDYEFNTPWAGPYDATRLKPVAYQGAAVRYAFTDALSLDVGDFWAWQSRTSNSFTNNTLLTTYPAGGGGIANNIFVPGCTGAQCNGISTSGFTYGHLGFAPKDANYSVNGYMYGVHDIVTMFWGDAKYTFAQSQLKPFVALQGGWENNGGNSVIGKIQSELVGFQAGVNATKNVLVSAGFDYIPWKNDTVPTAYLSSINWTCGNSNFTLKPAVGSVATHTLPYFLPLNAGQCFANSNGTTSIYYGGWASPYTDNYATDPIFTTQISQGMTDRRAPGTSWKIGATFTSNNKRFIFLASDAWYNYGNALVPENTNEWNLDGTYRFSPVPKTGFYKGLALRYRYMQRSLTNTYCGASGTSCPPGASIGSTFLGGLPLFKYNRAQLEYDF
jgi:hypothetical protein